MDDQGLVLIRDTAMGCYWHKNVCVHLCSHIEISKNLVPKFKIGLKWAFYFLTKIIKYGIADLQSICVIIAYENTLPRPDPSWDQQFLLIV